MNKTITACIGVFLVACAYLGLDARAAATQPTYPSQAWFLTHCAEDEVIGFSPRFGADEIGCIHIDELAN